tara:strand:+ start:979 stop:1614 length:636 start_codon:yes stop_codon:yes gene_type:complete
MQNKIVIIDDHKIFGEGFSSLLEANGFIVKRVFQEPILALKYFERNNKIDIVFTDINMPKINGIDLIEKIKKIDTNFKVIMMSMYSEKSIIKEAFLNNADGYLSKNCSIDDIKKAIKNAYSSSNKKNLFVDKSVLETSDRFSIRYKLTKREKEIIKNILDQKSNLEIGEALSISKRTVETHRKNIMLKLGVKNSVGIAVKALEVGLVNDAN